MSQSENLTSFPFVLISRHFVAGPVWFTLPYFVQKTAAHHLFPVPAYPLQVGREAGANPSWRDGVQIVCHTISLHSNAFRSLIKLLMGRFWIFYENLLPQWSSPAHALEFFCTHPKNHLQKTNKILQIVISNMHTFTNIVMLFLAQHIA